MVTVRFQKSSRAAIRTCSLPKVRQSYCKRGLRQLEHHESDKTSWTHHLVRQDQQVVLLGDISDAAKLLLVKDLRRKTHQQMNSAPSPAQRKPHLSDRVVGGVDPNHLGLRGDGRAKLVEVDFPVCRRDGCGGSVRRRVDGDEHGLATVEMDLSNVLVEDWAEHRGQNEPLD